MMEREYKRVLLIAALLGCGALLLLGLLDRAAFTAAVGGAIFLGAVALAQWWLVR